MKKMIPCPNCPKSKGIMYCDIGTGMVGMPASHCRPCISAIPASAANTTSSRADTPREGEVAVTPPIVLTNYVASRR